MATYTLTPEPDDRPPVRCSYCRWPAVPADNAEPDRAAISYPVIDSPLVQPGTRSVEIAQGQGCPFCGSPLFQSGGRRHGQY